eukprot:Gregarina_sp_Poly_1__5153@NODE_272_length_10257_cov_229_971246_g237_i0_p5_GENE_NODE_272_length_10257_cov_229_971246_g237_i0NODE_272_length_10257_cov_229_971246_g237_i0_p5_ORF_typecomplete_len229_score29_81_NODE_272_length_10257_cov_229_971246_g237_i021372823
MSISSDKSSSDFSDVANNPRSSNIAAEACEASSEASEDVKDKMSDFECSESNAVWEPARLLQKTYTNWDSKFVPYKSRFARIRRGRRTKIKISTDEDFKSKDRPDMFVGDITNYMGIWMGKGDAKENCDPLNTLTVKDTEKVLYFEVDGISPEITNQNVFEAWHKAFVSRKTLPSKLSLTSSPELDDIANVEYVMPMGDEWTFTENPLDAKWIGGTQFLGRVYISSPD